MNNKLRPNNYKELSSIRAFAWASGMVLWIACGIPGVAYLIVTYGTSPGRALVIMGGGLSILFIGTLAIAWRSVKAVG